MIRFEKVSRLWTWWNFLKYYKSKYRHICCFIMVKFIIFPQLEDLAPYGGQSSSSCGGLVVFGHQMGFLWAPWLVKFKFGALHTPPSSSCGELKAFIHLIGALQASRLVNLWVKSFLAFSHQIGPWRPHDWFNCESTCLS